MSERMPKVNELIHHHLGALIVREVELPAGVLVTITKVTVSADLRHARVMVSILPDDKMHKALKILRKETFNLQKLLGQEIVLRAIPKLNFVFDDTNRKTADIDQLIDSLEY